MLLKIQIKGRRVVSFIMFFAIVASTAFGNRCLVRIKAEEVAPKGSSITTRANGLFITEIYCNNLSTEGKNISGINDPMEYVELYNSTEEDIRFKDNYTINSVSGSPITIKSLLVEGISGEEIVIPKNSAVVLWVRRTELTDTANPLTVADFRSVHNIDAQIPVYSLVGQNGIVNTNGGFNLVNVEGVAVSNVRYTDADVTDGTSIHFKVSASSDRMLTYKQKSTPSAGVVEEEQLGYEEISAPIISCLDETITSIDEGEEMDIPYSYEDKMGMQKIILYYKTSSAKEYKTIETTSFRIAGKYFAKIPADELLNQDYVEYYLEGFNEFSSTKTTVKKMKINKIDDFTGIRTNLKEGQSLSGNVLITAKDKLDKKTVSIEIDDTKMKKVSLLEKGAFFTFGFTGIDICFKNAVSVGDNILTYIAKCSNVMTSKAVFVDQSHFTYSEDGSCVVTVSLWAGTQGSAFEIGNSNNNDDYKATGFHLVLTDGTVLDPDNGIDPNVIYKMGDSKGMTERLDIHYTVPADKVDALGYVWDTTLESDGIHNVTITSANDKKNIQVRVDNTAPQITTNITKENKLSNQCKAEITLSDDTGINENAIEVYLNENILKKPYSFSGSDLVEGNNKLVVKAVDLNGNQGTQISSFTYRNGKLVVSSMVETGAKRDSTYLKAVLSDKIRDKTKVTFYEGQRLEIGDEISVWQGTGDKTGSSVSGALGTVTSENGEFPYQIYEIKVKGELRDILQVKVGATASYNRPVQLYVYNVSDKRWEILKSNETDGIKKAEFLLDNHVENGVAKVLVQARGTETIPSSETAENGTIVKDYSWDGTRIPDQYDFSFAWITDTQFYSETWPEMFTTMNEWIIDQRKDKKIKYVICTGDLVDEFDQKYQWDCVDENMKYFEESNLPYGVIAGNHDVAAGNEIYENYYQYFGEDRFEDSLVYGESYKNNLGHYDLLTIDGEELIVLYMSWDIYYKETQWMNTVLQKYSDRKAILCFHRYTNHKGELDYTGQLVQKEVVAKNANVFAVLNGHYHGAAINVTAFDDDHDGIKERNVYQICTDYQSGDKGGTGYVKMIYFDLANDKVYMNSYSKELDNFNFYDGSKLDTYSDGVVAIDQDIYELDVDFNRSPRSLTTASMEATLFTNKIIGIGHSVDGVAEIEWKRLLGDKKYGWYTALKNDEGLFLRGDVNEFIFVPTMVPNKGKKHKNFTKEIGKMELGKNKVCE